MKLTLITSTTLLACAISFSVAAQDKSHAPPTATAMADNPAGTTATAGDGLALGLLAAINEHEIAAAKQAKAKKVSGQVLQYAQMMEKEHGENLAKTKSLGRLSNAAEVQAQKAKGASELKALNSTSGPAYSKAYIDAMVKGHTEALNTIDNTLLPAATSASVKAHLTDTRMHVAKHLDSAKAIAAKL